VKGWLRVNRGQTTVFALSICEVESEHYSVQLMIHARVILKDCDSLHLAEMPALAFPLTSDLSKGVTRPQGAQKHGWPEPLLCFRDYCFSTSGLTICGICRFSDAAMSIVVYTCSYVFKNSPRFIFVCVQIVRSVELFSVG
jgi:hypothetical protein